MVDELQLVTAFSHIVDLDTVVLYKVISDQKINCSSCWTELQTAAS